LANKIDKKERQRIKELYMASPHIEWFAFARSMGWDPTTSRRGLGVEPWINKKKEILSQEHAAKVAELLFNHKSTWHQQILTTLREYPLTADAIHKLIKYKINELVQRANKNDDAEKAGEKVEEKKKIASAEIATLASAYKTVTETKYKSLLIADWNVKVAEAVSTPESMKKEQEKSADTEWTIEVMGHEKVKIKDLQNALNDWYDRPMLPHTKEELDAES
jgi:hypothetical protein